MQDSRFDSIPIPQRLTDSGGVNDTGNLLTAASEKPISANTYLLPPGASDVFMLAPKQRMYGISLQADCRVSVAISEALPLETAP
jgi:hypothetical protein